MAYVKCVQSASISHLVQKWNKKLASTVAKLETEHEVEKAKIKNKLKKKDDKMMFDRSKNVDR